MFGLFHHDIVDVRQRLGFRSPFNGSQRATRKLCLLVGLPLGFLGGPGGGLGDFALQAGGKAGRLLAFSANIYWSLSPSIGSDPAWRKSRRRRPSPNSTARSASRRNRDLHPDAAVNYGAK